MMQSCPCMTSSPTVHVWGRFTHPMPFPYRRWWDGHGRLPSLWWCVLADGGLPQTDMYHLPLSTGVLDQSELFSKTSCVCVHMYLCTDVCSTMSSCSHIFSHHGRVHGTCCSWSVLCIWGVFGIRTETVARAAGGHTTATIADPHWCRLSSGLLFLFLQWIGCTSCATGA